jgi:hypothetical protein
MAAERKTLFSELSRIQQREQAIEDKLDLILKTEGLILANDARIIELLQPPEASTLVLTVGSPIPQ